MNTGSEAQKKIIAGRMLAGKKGWMGARWEEEENKAGMINMYYIYMKNCERINKISLKKFR